MISVDFISDKCGQGLVTKEHVRLQQLCVSMVETMKAEQGKDKPKLAKAPFEAYSR